MESSKDYEVYAGTLSASSVQNAFQESRDQAEKLLEDKDKTSEFLDKVEEKFAAIKGVGKELAKIPVMVQLIRSYIKKEYADIPIGSILAIIGALIYFLSPVDLIPDVLPVIGKVDDAMVIAIALKLVSADLDSYMEWRKEKSCEKNMNIREEDKL